MRRNFEPAETNWAASVPDLPGCMTTGQSLDETKSNIREVMEGHLARAAALRRTDPGKLPAWLAASK